ncbi:uncharacterized protein C9orf85 homolog isoform X2 [Aotus nancymaae]|uniref:uncharacterized protein C9orf85 homolog isoform X2 n=1 Tax=Aotus nancymaae TaxID=37293 RepID=UPI000626C33D|nr:uncharacterized protein C9orf85 homolog [Aotus nancymaae]
MSSQKGNVVRSRPQKHQNTFSFKNDKFDKSVQTKKVNAKLHDGVCQHCKEVLEWRVKYSKYKPLSKPKKCSGGQKSKIKVLAGHAPSASSKGGIFLVSASFWLYPLTGCPRWTA